jgi:hypothetical protein
LLRFSLLVKDRVHALVQAALLYTFQLTAWLFHIITCNFFRRRQPQNIRVYLRSSVDIQLQENCTHKKSRAMRGFESITLIPV